MPCTFQAYGKNFEPEKYVKDFESLKPIVSQRGQKVSPRSERIHEESSFFFDVSLRGFDDLDGQIADTILFLKNFRQNLKRLPLDQNCEERVLDFGYECKLNMSSCVVQCEYLPTELLVLAGELKINIMLSLYPKIELKDKFSADSDIELGKVD